MLFSSSMIDDVCVLICTSSVNVVMHGVSGEHQRVKLERRKRVLSIFALVTRILRGIEQTISIVLMIQRCRFEWGTHRWIDFAKGGVVGGETSEACADRLALLVNFVRTVFFSKKLRKFCFGVPWLNWGMCVIETLHFFSFRNYFLPWECRASKALQECTLRQKVSWIRTETSKRRVQNFS